MFFKLYELLKTNESLIQQLQLETVFFGSKMEDEDKRLTDSWRVAREKLSSSYHHQNHCFCRQCLILSALVMSVKRESHNRE